MVLEILSDELDGALGRSDVVGLTFALLLQQVENSVVDEGVKSVVEELSYRHVLMVVLVLDHHQERVKHVLVRAALLSSFDVFHLLVVLPDLLHIEVNFLGEQIFRVIVALKAYFN